MTNKTPEQQLAAFIARFTPEVQEAANAALAKMRQRFPHANQLVYDNYNALAIGFGPTVYAPNAAVTLSGNGDWYGSMVVHTLNDSGNGHIHYDRSLGK